MKYVFVDFEMNPIERAYSRERKLYKQEIIEIGAVMLDEDMNEVSSFKSYVKPQYSSEIARKIYELTGITKDDIFYAKTIEVELEAFANWCVKESNDEYVVYAWSENDLKQITNEIDMKSIVISNTLQSVIDSWKDLQLEYDKVIASEKRTGLTRALESLGIYFEGKMHDALDDSRNTATIFKELQNPDQMLASMEEIRSYYSSNTDNKVTLGDLFDFAALGLSL